MLWLHHSADACAQTPSEEVSRLLADVSENHLREVVEVVSIPRHYAMDPFSNKQVREYLATELRSYGYHVECQGQYDNLLAFSPPLDKPITIVGAHYDSYPNTPGADDNGSALAALLSCARALSLCSQRSQVLFIAFNREEDGLLGSHDFVANYLPRYPLQIHQVHVLEMVGYCSYEPESQKLPPRLPISAPDTGDFLGVIGNRHSHHLVDCALRRAKTYLPEFSVLGLKIPLGLEKWFPVLLRSDHAPFWHAKIPALMWTDTSEYRNPHYHAATDTPDTLDYAFLRKVSQLLLASVLQS